MYSIVVVIIIRHIFFIILRIDFIFIWLRRWGTGMRKKTRNQKTETKVFQLNWRRSFENVIHDWNDRIFVTWNVYELKIELQVFLLNLSKYTHMIWYWLNACSHARCYSNHVLSASEMATYFWSVHIFISWTKASTRSEAVNQAQCSDEAMASDARARMHLQYRMTTNKFLPKTLLTSLKL